MGQINPIQWYKFPVNTDAKKKKKRKKKNNNNNNPAWETSILGNRVIYILQRPLL